MTAREHRPGESSDERVLSLLGQGSVERCSASFGVRTQPRDSLVARIELGQRERQVFSALDRKQRGAGQRRCVHGPFEHFGGVSRVRVHERDLSPDAIELRKNHVVNRLPEKRLGLGKRRLSALDVADRREDARFEQQSARVRR